MEATITTAAKAAQRTAKTVSTASKVAGLLRTIRKNLTAPRIYRMELRITRATARWIDRHHTLSNAILYAQVIGFAIYVFLNY